MERVPATRTNEDASGRLISITHNWLDMQVTAGSGVCIRLQSKNREALTGQGAPAHASLPIFRQWDGATKERARWWLLSRVHRIAHIGGCSQAHDMQKTFYEMELFGYPKKRIRRLASSCRRSCPWRVGTLTMGPLCSAVTACFIDLMSL